MSLSISTKIILATSGLFVTSVGSLGVLHSQSFQGKNGSRAGKTTKKPQERKGQLIENNHRQV